MDICHYYSVKITSTYKNAPAVKMYACVCLFVCVCLCVCLCLNCVVLLIVLSH